MQLQRNPLNPRQKPKSSEPVASEGQYRTIFDRYPHPAWVLDRATFRLLAVNDAATTLFGYTREELLSMTYLDLFTPEEAMGVRRKLTQQSSSRGATHWRMRTKAAVSVHVESAWRPIPYNRVPAILLTAGSTGQGLNRLVQETEEGRDRLEALSRRLVQIQEAERAEIARELHDEIGQLLTGLKLMLTASVQGGGVQHATPEAAAHSAEMVTIVNELIGRIRDLSMNLRPLMLDEIGLVAALQWHFERYTARTKVRVSFRHALSGSRFPAIVEIAAFRIIQEALTNAARYANVDTILVDMKADQKYLKLRIEDSGLGFDQHGAPAGRSAGLTGMHERALLIGGHLTIESAPDSGTRIVVELPLRDDSETWN